MISFELTTPERVAFKSEATSVTLPTMEGEITILPHHIPLLSVLSPGMITVKHANGAEEYLAVGGGFVQVSFAKKDAKDAVPTRVVVLADTADRSDELTAEAVEAARERARKALQDANRDDAAAFGAAAVALEREIARLKVVRRKHHRSA